MKNSISRIIVFFFVLLYVQKVNCQNVGNVYFFVSPENSIIRIDTMLFIQKKEIIYLTPGNYPVKMWAYGRKLVYDTLNAKENTVTFFRRKLPMTDE